MGQASTAASTVEAPNKPKLWPSGTWTEPSAPMGLGQDCLFKATSGFSPGAKSISMEGCGFPVCLFCPH